jgi:predicted MFS family arabinose efflux permease
MKYVGYVEIVVGLGLSLGLVIGSALFEYVQYQGIMYFFAGLNLLVAIFVCVMIPQELNNTVSDK